MSETTLLDWFVPVVSWAALAVWIAALHRALPALRDGWPIPEEARIATAAAVLLLAGLLALSSLAYPDLIPADWSRFLLLAARVSLLVTGLFAWAELRR